MEVKYTCPLGSECEVAKDGYIERCAWYVKLRGQDPQTGEPLEQRRCSMAWQPILMIEGNGAAHHLNSNIQSLRNETVKRQDAALGVISNAKTLSSK